MGTSHNDLLVKVVAAASQGAAGAIVGAFLACVTDPVTNRLLVKRMTLSQALADVDFEQCISYFRTTLPTNFIKFPLFEVLNVVTAKLNMPDNLKGVAAGAIFTTATLPLTNYRYCKSVREDVQLSSPKLWKAYLPTVIRDIAYANARNYIAAIIQRSHPGVAGSVLGRILSMFVTVVAACIISSPGNEWRGYSLQPANARKPLSEFFQTARYLRSTLIGAVVMGISLGLATVVGPPVQRSLPYLKDPRVVSAMLALWIAYRLNKGSEE